LRLTAGSLCIKPTGSGIVGGAIRTGEHTINRPAATIGTEPARPRTIGRAIVVNINRPCFATGGHRDEAARLGILGTAVVFGIDAKGLAAAAKRPEMACCRFVGGAAILGIDTKGLGAGGFGNEFTAAGPVSRTSVCEMMPIPLCFR